MFRKILIANRGEIACRVIVTCRKLAIATVAVYSDADASALHVAMADEAFAIGAAPVAQSYLQGERIIAAALASGAEAIHPGYGFLSEYPDFAEAVAAAGLVFIGPSPNAIRKMGLKDAAKTLMSAAGVPVVPGYHGSAQDGAFLARKADEIGYPVLIKARAGGGGKGMRLVEHAEHFPAALESARREAQASFGDPACLIETYIRKPRHIEIQVMGDKHGNVVHLFERDCSSQRRHQKVIEEAPAPGMTETMRAAMGKAAVDAARAIGYSGAGTVEFIVDATDGLRQDRFWFMEMNTRLQVEHPVSEAITGLDFVELQLQVAAGEPLPLRQEDIALNGWAIEARIYAEDAGKNFMPSIGRLDHLSFTPGTAFINGPVRIDSGVRQGDSITPFYDPMIAKVIVHGSDRQTALARMSSALAGCRVAGSVTNLAFLSRLVDHPDFRADAVDTGFIERHLSELAVPPPGGELALRLAALESAGLIAKTAGPDPWSCLVGWTQWIPPSIYIQLEHDDMLSSQSITLLGGGRYRFSEGEEAADLTILRDADGSLAVIADGHRTPFETGTTGPVVTIFLHGSSFSFRRPQMRGDTGSAGDDRGDLAAVMPGVITMIHARKGDVVERGDPLLAMEAMKMEQTFAAQRRAVVADILVEVGSQVSEGAILLTFEPEKTDA